MRTRVLQDYIEPNSLYSCETWTTDKIMTKNLKTIEMWFWRKIQQTHWTDRERHKEASRKLKDKGH